MASPADVSRSFKFDISNLLPEGHEKPLKQAFYNVAAIVFVVFIFAACVAVYYVLEPFLRPLLWAVLFGSVLHPFKHSMTVVLRRWLHTLHDTGTPLTVGAVTSPFSIIDHISERLWNLTLQYVVMFISIVGGVFAAILIYNCVPSSVSDLLSNVLGIALQGVSSLLEFCHGATLFVWTVIVGYIVTISLWWNSSTKPYLICLSPAVWTVFICHLVSVAGSLRLTILLSLIALMLIGFLAEVKGRYSEPAITEQSDRGADSFVLTPISAVRSSWAWLRRSDDNTELPSEVVDQNEEDIDNVQQNVQVDPSTPVKVQSQVLIQNTEEKMSNFYIYGLLWACLLTQIWRHIWLFNLLLIPTIYMGIKRAVVRFGILSFIQGKLAVVLENWGEVFEQRREALIPSPLRGLWRILVLGDKKVLYLLEGSIDTFTSIMTIFAVMLFAIIGTVFLSVQIYGESMHLVTVTSSLINQTVHNTDIQQLVPESLRDVQGTLDSMFGDAYVYGRSWISSSVIKRKNGSHPIHGNMKFPSLVRRIIDDKNDERAEELEKQILEIFDRVYELWVTRNSNATTSDLKPVASFDSLLDGLKTLNMDLIANFVKENIGTLLSVLDSVWTILKGNISLALSALTAIVSLLFGGGTAVLNFVLNFIVFSTSLFYLLCASGEQYKPVEVCSSLMPSAGSGTKFGRAVEEAINGVFAASFKMAAFYGLYTWLIHTLFDVKMVYISSVLAALFGAVPFLGPYWACMPAVLELWLVNGQIIKAGLMMAAQLIPTSFVDSAIYSEITGGGHPYLTGLAIAGGVFYSGFEGALFGPMLLCVLYVAMHMYGTVIHPTCMMEDTRRASRPFSLKRMFTIE